MIELLGGFRISQALYAAAVLGIADELVADPAPVEVLAAQAGAHAPSLYRLLRTLAGAGVFTEPEPSVFALTPLGQTLTSDQPGSLRGLAIMWMETHYAPFADLIHTVRTGQPAAEHLYGESFFTWLSHHPEHAARFTGAMANLTGGFKTAAIASLPLDGIETIVDVGGAEARCSRPSWAHTRTCAACYSTFPMSSPAHPASSPAAASVTGPTASAATSSTPCHPAATPTSRPLCCTTGPTRTPNAFWPTSPPPAGAAHGC
jgi:Dimerisation domain